MKAALTFTLVSVFGVAAGGIVVAQLPYDVFPDAGSHGAWYAARSAGMAAYLAVWGSLIVGVVMSSAWLDGMVSRARLLAAHQALALTGLALGLGHALVLIPDGFTAFGAFDLLVPFGSYYEPVLTGLGTVALYLFAIVSFSFWFRNRIGMRLWRAIHMASLVAYGAALWHGVRLGTDSGELWAGGIYLVTFALLAGALTTRLTYVRPARAPKKVASSAT